MIIPRAVQETQEFMGRVYRRYPKHKNLSSREYFKSCRWENSKRVNSYLHRDIWECHNGPIRQGYVVHHIDDNKQNNSIQNLQIISKRDHQVRHITSCGRMEKHCVVCGKTFQVVVKFKNHARYCSGKCCSNASRLREVN
jgi:hypothetical protein